MRQRLKQEHKFSPSYALRKIMWCSGAFGSPHIYHCSIQFGFSPATKEEDKTEKGRERGETMTLVTPVKLTFSMQLEIS